ncbi:MAG: TonB-dependent receptor [Saprospiraceae bacterium]
MKKLLSVFVALFMIMNLNAQIIVSGRVVTESGESLIGANAILENTFNGDQSALEGYFTITNVAPDSQYKLVVSYIGYETFEKEITVTSEDIYLKITLKKNSIISDEVVVYSTRANKKTPTTFTNLKKIDIEKNNFGQDMPYVLEFTPSAVVTSDAGNGVGYTGIRIRGSDPTRVNVTINGVPLNDAESQGVFWVNMPDFASNTENIQIQRGVGTSTNGGSAFGASVNLLTSNLNKDFYAELNNSVGSFNTIKNTFKIGSGLIADKFAFDGRISRITSDGFVDRANSDLFSYYLSGAYYGKDQSLRFNMFHGHEVTYQAWYGVTFDQIKDFGRTYNPAGQERAGEPYDNQVDDYQQTHYQLVYTKEFNSNFNFNTTAHYTKGKGFYEEYKSSEDFGDYGLAPDTLSSDLVRQRWLDNHFYGLVFSANYASKNKRLTATLGGGWNQYLGKHFGDVIWLETPSLNSVFPARYYENDATKQDFNLYAKVNYQVNSHINAFLDLQGRRVSYTFEGIDQNGLTLGQTAPLNFFNPKAGLTYEVNPNLNFYGFFGVANKEPNRDDFVDNPPSNQPKHERLYDTEIGYRQVFKNAAININYYQMYYRNQLVVTGEINDVGAAKRTNIDRSFRSGLELSGRARINNSWEWSGNVAFSNNQILQFDEYLDAYDGDFNWIGKDTLSHENTNIAFSPNFILGNQLTYKPFINNSRINKKHQLDISLLTKWIGKQYIDNSNGHSIDPYMTNDIRVRYGYKFGNSAIGKFFDEASVNLLVKNIFNIEYEPNAWSYRYNFDGSLSQDIGYYPQAGTNVMLSVNLRF